MIEVTDKVRRESFMIIETVPELEKRKGLKGDYENIAMLIILYILQGIPLGIIVTIPMIMASNNVSYSSQAIFTFAKYPYVMKLIWAPIVDSVYSIRFGRRKSWLVPAQYCLSASMFLMSVYINELIGDKAHLPQIYMLTTIMFLIILFAAAQDVAVDAWSISLLARRNVHYASSCNSVGVIFGKFLSTTLFLSLESAEFCNKWLRKTPQNTGMITLKDFFFSAGIVLAVTTTIIWIFKNETNSMDENDDKRGVWNTYKTLFRLLQLRALQLLASVQLTQYIGHAVVVFVTDLKLIEFGLKKENLSLLQSPIAALNLVIPFLMINKAKKNPLVFFWKASLFKLVIGSFVVAVVWWTQSFHKPKDGFPYYYYVVLFSVLVIYDIAKYGMSMSIWAFKIHIADPDIGATYMTLLTMLSHIGAKWTGTLSLWVIDLMGIKLNIPFVNTKHFIPTESSLIINTQLNSSDYYNASGIQRTNEIDRSPVNATSEYIIDGYFTQFAICTILGIVWLIGYKSLLKRMQEWPETKWRFKNEAKTKF